MAIKSPILPPWADAGDKVAPSSAEIAEGWPQSNVPPSRQRFNWILNFLANGNRYLQQVGLSDWDSQETYSIYDRTRGSNGKSYRSTENNNLGNDPTTTPAKWERWGYTFAELIDEVDAITGLTFKNQPIYGLAVTETLQVANAGQPHSVNIAGTTLVLPTMAAMTAAGQVGNGFPIRFGHDTLVTVDPDATATDYLLLPKGGDQLTQHTFKKGEFAYIYANGVEPASDGGWYVLFSGFGSDSFKQTLGANYANQELPGGFRKIVGLFTASATPGAAITVNFADAFGGNTEFANACTFIAFTPIANSATPPVVWLSGAPTNASFQVRCDTASLVVRYEATGH
jgi:hypothetical protein